MTQPDARYVLIGCYTTGAGGSGTGISLLTQDESGHPKHIQLAAEATSPAFLAKDPSGQHIYAVSEVDGEGSVLAFAVQPDGTLRTLNSQPTGGVGPCHLTVHPSGRYVLSANYVSGSVAVHPIAEDGSLRPRSDLVQHAGSGPETDRQEGPHAHNVQVDRAGEHIIVADLGTDELRSYRLNLERGKLETGPVAHANPGSGPRHVAYHGDGRVFVANELDSTVTTYTYDAGAGELNRGDSVPATVEAPGAERNYPSEILVSRDGRFVYVANRGNDVITTFAVGESALEPVADVPAGGAWPRHIGLVGDCLWAANQNSDNIVAFSLDPEKGLPTQIGSIDSPSPSCVLPLF